MEKTFTESEVKDFTVQLLSRMMPRHTELKSMDAKLSDAMTLIEFGQDRANNLGRLVYLRAIEEIDLRLNEFISTKTV